MKAIIHRRVLQKMNSVSGASHHYKNSIISLMYIFIFSYLKMVNVNISTLVELLAETRSSTQIIYLLNYHESCIFIELIRSFLILQGGIKLYFGL